MAQQLAEGDTSLLGEMHATTSGLKVFATTATVRDIETARRSMGGHGFSVFSGLSRVYGQYLPSATFVSTLSSPCRY
jgi:acyl-CoA oxidase